MTVKLRGIDYVVITQTRDIEFGILRWLLECPECACALPANKNRGELDTSSLDKHAGWHRGTRHGEF